MRPAAWRIFQAAYKTAEHGAGSFTLALARQAVERSPIAADHIDLVPGNADVAQQMVVEIGEGTFGAAPDKSGEEGLDDGTHLIFLWLRPTRAAGFEAAAYGRVALNRP